MRKGCCCAQPLVSMSLSAEREDLFKEAFEILGKKAAEVDKPTVAIIMRSLGQNPTNDEANALYDKYSGGAQSVAVDVLLKIAAEFEATMKSKDQNKDLQEAFAVFDKDNSGKISAAELRHVISNIGEKLEEDEIEDMMLEADTCAFLCPAGCVMAPILAAHQGAMAPARVRAHTLHTPRAPTLSHAGMATASSTTRSLWPSCCQCSPQQSKLSGSN